VVVSEYLDTNQRVVQSSLRKGLINEAVSAAVNRAMDDLGCSSDLVSLTSKYLITHYALIVETIHVTSLGDT
jgi:hypothetical protein